MDDRMADVLRILVEQYIAGGKPVGSKAIAEALANPVSSATVRNVMAMLEARGLVVSPHTSAGRVPTELGYRFFVDGLLKISPLTDAVESQLRQQLDPQKSSAELVAAASELISELTAMTCVVVSPTHEQAKLRHIEFLSLDEQRVLVVLVFNKDEVENRIIQVDRPFTKAELQQASNLLSEQFAGMDLKSIRASLLAQLKDHRQQLDSLMKTTIELADAALSSRDDAEPNYVVSGQSKLFYIADAQGGMEQLRLLFDSFQQKRELLGLMDRCIQGEGVQIFIGKESGYQVLNNCSLVTSTYASSEDDLLGMLAVIGPTRMPYQRVIPTVDMAAKILGAALKSNY